MRIVFLISYKNDPELVALYYELGAKLFSNFIKDALRHVVRLNYVGAVDVPNVLLLDSSKEKEKIKINLSLAAAKDADVASLLQSLKPKMVSKFVKQCTKLYLGTKGLEAFFNDNMNEKLSPSANPRIAPVVFQFGESAQISNCKKVRTSSTRKQAKQKLNPVVNVTPDLSKSQNQQSTTTQSPFSVSAPEQERDISAPVAIETPNQNTGSEYETISETNTDEDDVLAMLESLLS